MATRKIYSASLEKLPYDFAEWQTRKREGRLEECLPEENPDWLRRARAGGEYQDYDFGGMYRFSEEGELPGKDKAYGPNEGPCPLNILRCSVENDTTGRRKFVLNLETEEE
jgi:hypothetical protein